MCFNIVVVLKGTDVRRGRDRGADLNLIARCGRLCCTIGFDMQMQSLRDSYPGNTPFVTSPR